MRGGGGEGKVLDSPAGGGKIYNSDYTGGLPCSWGGEMSLEAKKARGGETTGETAVGYGTTIWGTPRKKTTCRPSSLVLVRSRAPKRGGASERKEGERRPTKVGRGGTVGASGGGRK